MPPCNREYTIVQREQILKQGQSEEVRRVQNRINGFHWKNSQAWAVLSCLYGDRTTQAELVEIARLVSQKAGITLDRDAQRRKIVIIKWFEENLPIVQPLLPSIVLE